VGKSEWAALAEDSRPALRFCAPVGMPHYAVVKTSEKAPCAWCGCLVWFDAAQEMPDIIRMRGSIKICAGCAMADDEIRAAILENMPDVYKTWAETGVVKPIRFGEEP
jgi:Zn-finger protein